MAITPLPIGNGFYLSDSLPISAQECVNWYVNIPQAPALNDKNLFGTPGITQNATSGSTMSDNNRGSWDLDGVPYFVNGTKLLRLESDLVTLTDLGTIAGSGRVFMADNGTQLCILVPGTTSTGYIFTANPDSLQTITDLDFKANGEPQTVRYADSYFVFTTDSKKFIISSVNDGLTYNALDFGSAESDPDDIVSIAVLNNQIFVCGTETIEGFQNIGGADFPFQRTGLFINKGVRAASSVVNSSGTFMFIGGSKGESPAIWASDGSSSEPIKVSTTAIDSLLQAFTETEISESFAWSYAQKGAYFVGFRLPTTTLVFDTVAKLWGERKSQITSNGIQVTQTYRVNSIVSAYGKLWVGDSQDGRIGCLDPDVYTEYGFNIVRIAATQPFQNNMQAMFFPWIELTMEAGVGNNEVTEPVIRMDLSEDGGKTFKDERWRKIGKIGEYIRRTIWRRNGRIPRFAVLRFTLSDAVKPVIIQLTADVTG